MRHNSNLTENVFAQLDEIITSSNLGDRLPTEKELSEKLGVGRSTIRECMMVYVAKKIVTRSNEGSFVSENIKDCLVDPLNFMLNMKIGTIQDLMELRESLELITIQLAAIRATEENLFTIEQKNWLLKEPGLSLQEMQKRDTEFHRAIAESTGNQVLTELVGALRTILVDHVENNENNTSNLSTENLNLHDEMISHIRNHDPENAYKSLQNYFTEIRNVTKIPRVK